MVEVAVAMLNAEEGKGRGSGRFAGGYGASAGGRGFAETRRGTFGSDAGELTEWGIRAPETPIGRLKCCGLLVEATVDRVQSVFIPAGLPLDAAWFQETKT